MIDCKHIMCCLLGTSILLSSCAYMQTHKNIEESFCQHTGYHLTPQIELYRAGMNYYIAAEQQLLRKHYPIIHDTIFLNDNNEPTYSRIGNTSAKVYHTISKGTADILQTSNGYASLDVLSDELRTQPGEWLAILPEGASKCAVRAEIVGSPYTWQSNSESPTAPLAAQILGTADQVIIDWPGTVLYNLSIPIMAPFVFFHQFLNEQ